MPWTVFFLTVLSRVKDFLPVMREAELALEQELQVKSPTELDIESVDDGAPFIEMVSITLYTLTSECIFFLLFSIRGEVLTRRICWKIRSCFSGWSFPWPWCLIQGWYCKEKLDVSHSSGQRIEKKNASQLFSASKIACWSTQPPDSSHALEARCFWHWRIIFS